MIDIESTELSSSIGVLRWKTIKYYLEEDPDFVMTDPAQLAPPPTRVNPVMGGGGYVFFEYLDSLI